MEKTPNHQVQGTVSDPEDMDTDRNPETITMGEGGRLTSGMKGTPDEPQLESGHHSTRLSSMGKATEGGQEHTILPTLGTGQSIPPHKFPPQKNTGKSKSPTKMGPEIGSPSPPVAPKPALKRKVPPEIEELLSGGSSVIKPIDMDTLNAVLERFPVKHELQVHNFKISTSTI